MVQLTRRSGPLPSRWARSAAILLWRLFGLLNPPANPSLKRDEPLRGDSARI